MKFTVIVNAHPDSLASASALRFCQALLKREHTLYRIFFYGEGVLNGATSEASGMTQSWSHLIQENGVDAVCCVGSAAQRSLHSDDDLLGGFTLSGLGQMIDGLVNSDRTITFGKRVALA